MWLKQSEDKCRLRVRRVHPRFGGCAERLSDGTFECKTKGRHGLRLSYFVSQDILHIFGNPEWVADARNASPG